MPNLAVLDFSGNPVASIESYRERMFDNCANLEVLDGQNKEGEEVDLSTDEEDLDDAEGGEDDVDDMLGHDMIN